MVTTTDTLDGKLRERGRKNYYKKVDAAWAAFQTAVRPDTYSSYSESIHKHGADMIEKLKIENKARVEQLEVDNFLKRFEELEGQMQDLHHG